MPQHQRGVVNRVTGICKGRRRVQHGSDVQETGTCAREQANTQPPKFQGCHETSIQVRPRAPALSYLLLSRPGGF